MFNTRSICSCSRKEQITSRFLPPPGRYSAHPHSHLFHLELLQGNIDHIQVFTCPICSCSMKAQFISRFLPVPSAAVPGRHGSSPGSYLFHLQLFQEGTVHLQVLTCSICSCSRKAQFISRFLPVPSAAAPGRDTSSSGSYLFHLKLLPEDTVHL